MAKEVTFSLVLHGTDSNQKKMMEHLTECSYFWTSWLPYDRRVFHSNTARTGYPNGTFEKHWPQVCVNMQTNGNCERSISSVRAFNPISSYTPGTEAGWQRTELLKGPSLQETKTSRNYHKS